MHARLLSAALTFSLTASLAAQAYETNFESFAASATGTPVAGQDGFYVAAVAGSLDWKAFSYANNSLGMPAHPSGGSKFVAGVSGGGTALARIQRPMAFDANQPWRWSVDFCANFTGTSPASEYIGSFSQQPSTTAANFNVLLMWGSSLFTPTTFSVGIQGYDAAGAALAISPVGDFNFQNLGVLTWYRLEATWDFATNLLIQMAITDLATGVRSTWTPFNLYLFGGAAGAPLPSDFRLFCGGNVVGNAMACDNLSISAVASYTNIGSGCAGTMGVPTLGAAPNSLPVPGTTFGAVVGNLPVGVGIMASGFSSTSTGTLTLPLSLAPIGLTGCTLYVDPVVTDLLLASGNQATWSLVLPNSSSLLHARLFQQAFSLDPPANAAGLTVSNAAMAIVGR